jgi:hypothetical protein
MLVDVREPDEYKTVRANGAVLVPMSEFAARAAELPKDRPIYLICASGSRSAAAAGFLPGAAGRTSRTSPAERPSGSAAGCRSTAADRSLRAADRPAWRDPN